MVTVLREPGVDARCPGIRTGILHLEAFRNTAPVDALEIRYAAVIDAVVAAWTGKTAADDPVLSAVRRMYHAFGMDPTRYRPSPERLVRRAVQGKDVPRISPAVDLCNLVSLSTRVPLGLYDAARIAGPVTVRVGGPEERYDALNGESVGAAGRLIVADTLGPIGGPTYDSVRTRVEPDTTSLLVLAWFPPEVTAGAEVLDAYRVPALTWCGARVVQQAIL